ncbi:MAG: methyltransferase domain-containing protein [Bacteroidetes bacterium]|nr:methyltransferase domain-containing protein [Bacteroidota bacterium]HET6245978.1 methyltransferase domain-containing protein [Bacteroidia bacterium]
MVDNPQWYKDWFNSPYYHILYKHRDETEAADFIANLKKYLNIPAQSKILDLACGKGRHSLQLYQEGYDVTGVDLSEESINYAQKFENENLHFYKHDMRRPFRANYFDYVLNLFSSFGYFNTDKEHANSIKHAATALKKDGVLVIDFFNMNKIKNELVAQEFKSVSGIDFKIKKSIVDNSIVKEINFTEKGLSHCYIEKVRLLTVDDFKGYFDLAGLELIALKGNYQMNEFNTLNSPRLILFAKKI